MLWPRKARKNMGQMHYFAAGTAGGPVLINTSELLQKIKRQRPPFPVAAACAGAQPPPTA
jgi:hypothetical protein